MAKEAAASTTGAAPAAPRTYKILVAHDHSIVRRGIRSLLESQPDLEVCAEAADGVTTMDCVLKQRPDLVVLDLTMPEKNGLEVARMIRERSPSTDVLILTMHFSEEVARSAALRRARIRSKVRRGRRVALRRAPHPGGQAVFYRETGRHHGGKLRPRYARFG